ncbi:uncharacterized protein LOC133655916 [Entelurus aequoreus]|uniref:uncharacterized protein LOC133655916 n=1 Tax=Entelurus aequoreus TaxID=161455 RepID=UPI002B1CF4F2|nr:uncharacterized protein LOC133655916 [Entelurus aequoreus]
MANLSPPLQVLQKRLMKDMTAPIVKFFQGVEGYQGEVIRRYQEENRRYQEKNHRYQEKNHRYQEENHRYQEENLRYQEENRRYQVEIRHYQEEDRRHQEAIRHYQEEDSRHQEQNHRYQEENQRHQEENGCYQEEISRYKGEIRHYQEEDLRHQEENRRYQEEIRHYQEEDRRHQEEDRRHQEENNRYQEENRRYQEEDRRHQEEDRRHQEENHRCQEENRRCQEENRRCQEENRRYQEEIRHYQEEDKRHQEEDRRHQEENHRYQEDIRHYQEENRRHQEEKHRYQEENRRYQEEIRHYQEEIRHYQEEDRRHQEEDRRHQEENCRHQENDRRNQEENHCYQEENHCYQEENRRYQEENRRYQEENRRYQEENHRYQEENRRYQEENRRYQEENRRLRRLLKGMCNSEMKDCNKSASTVGEQAPKRDTPVEPELAEPLMKKAKMDQTEQLTSGASEPLTAEEVLQPTGIVSKEKPTGIVSKEEPTEMSVSHVVSLSETCPKVPKEDPTEISVSHVVSLSETCPQVPKEDPTEISVSHVVSLSETCPKVPEEEHLEVPEPCAVEPLAKKPDGSDAKEKDNKRLEDNITSPLQDITFGNLNTTPEIPRPRCSKELDNLGSLKPPKTSDTKTVEDTLQKTIYKFPRRKPDERHSVVTDSPDNTCFLQTLFQDCKNLPENKKPLLFVKYITNENIRLMNRPRNDASQSSRGNFTYHSDAPEWPQMPMKDHALKPVTCLPEIRDRELKDRQVINCDAEHKEVTERLQKLSGRRHSKLLIFSGAQEEEMKSQALGEYCRNVCVNWSPCSLVIHPDAAWLGAMPHGMVYDPKETPTFGLVHISCSSLQSFMACPFLSFQDEAVRLKPLNNLYCNIQGEIMVTGVSWCDLVVFAKDDMLVQRIYRDRGRIESLKKQLDVFYSQHYLPSISKT